MLAYCCLMPTSERQSSLREVRQWLKDAAEVIDLPFKDEPVLVGTNPGGAGFVSHHIPGIEVRGFLQASPDDGLSLTELRVKSLTGEPIQSKTMRDIKLGHLLPIVQAQLVHLANTDKARRRLGLPSITKEQRVAAKAARVEKKALGRSPLPADHYRLVAECLLQELERHPARGIHEHLAERLTEQLGRPVNRDTARDWVRVARSKEQGWLAPTRQGVPGAMPGPKLIAARQQERAQERGAHQ